MASDNIFVLNFKLMAERLMPPRMRKVKHTSWLGALLYPLQEKRDEVFGTERPNTIEQMKYNGQTIILEQILRDAVSNTSAPFIEVITLDTDDSNFYVSETVSDGADYVASDFGFQEDFVPATNSINLVNFEVQYPTALGLTAAQLTELEGLVKKYKLMGTTYQFTAV